MRTTMWAEENPLSNSLVSSATKRSSNITILKHLFSKLVNEHSNHDNWIRNSIMIFIIVMWCHNVLELSQHMINTEEELSLKGYHQLVNICQQFLVPHLRKAGNEERYKDKIRYPEEQGELSYFGKIISSNWKEI